jgi:hypothetical protein
MCVGVLGFGKGIAQGLIGAAVKPVGGVLSFASKTTAGIKVCFIDCTFSLSLSPRRVCNDDENDLLLSDASATE